VRLHTNTTYNAQGLGRLSFHTLITHGIVERGAGDQHVETDLAKAFDLVRVCSVPTCERSAQQLGHMNFHSLITQTPFSNEINFLH
jgi:hypothetical protein